MILPEVCVKIEIKSAIICLTSEVKSVAFCCYYVMSVREGNSFKKRMSEILRP